MRRIRRMKFTKPLRQFIEAGGIYVGVSDRRREPAHRAEVCRLHASRALRARREAGANRPPGTSAGVADQPASPPDHGERNGDHRIKSMRER